MNEKANFVDAEGKAIPHDDPAFVRARKQGQKIGVRRDVVLFPIDGIPVDDESRKPIGIPARLPFLLRLRGAVRRLFRRREFFLKGDKGEDR